MIRSAEFQVELSSELVVLLNFLVFEIAAMAYVMYLSSLVAGALNHARLASGGVLDLRVFAFPHVGGGLVMSHAWARRILIFLRASALLAVTASNLGLEGRTVDRVSYHEVAVRGPGVKHQLTAATMFNATERRMRCARSVGDEIIFGSVVDGVCYPELATGLQIRSISLQYERFRANATQCSVHVNHKHHTSVFRCREADVSCLGIFESVDAPGLREEGGDGGRCKGVIYQDGVSWLCPVRSVVPGVLNKEVSCRRMDVRRKYIREWPDIYPVLTWNFERAIFGAAYGVELRKMVRVPIGRRNVTVIHITWVACSGYVIVVIVFVTAWVLYVGGGRKRVGHDERTLLKLIDEKYGFGHISEAAVFQSSLKESRVGVSVDGIILGRYRARKSGRLEEAVFY